MNTSTPSPLGGEEAVYYCICLNVYYSEPCVELSLLPT